MKKSLEDLAKIREQMKSRVNLRRETDDGTRIVVGMATCGIAAGAKPVLEEFVAQVAKRDLQNVFVSQTGCIGLCRLEPIVEVYIPGQEKVTYVKMTPDKVERIITEHIVNNHVVSEYTIGENS